MQFEGRAWIMPDDVDTDNIIPGQRGTIPTIEEMKKYAFEYLKPNFGAQAQPGDIIVAGKNFGCGSSREQAASVIIANGVGCVIAESFARIFFRNAFNKGIVLIQCAGVRELCKEWDTVKVVPNQYVEVNGKRLPVKQIPENLFQIVESGGLIENTKARLATHQPKVKNTPLTREQMMQSHGHTLAEKLLMKNAGKEDVAPGDIVVTNPDMMMIHDIYTPYLLDTLEKIGATEIDNPERATIIFDHCMPTAVPHNDSAHYDAGVEIARRYHITKLHIGEGICHSLMHEKRYGRPGEIATATDSHTTTYGGAGCFCTGIGTAEMAAALITGELWFKVPEAIQIVLNGELPQDVLSKDVILKILGDIKSHGAQYKSMEFTGPAAKAMSMAARFTVANMALEAGAKCGLFDADEKTAEYYGVPMEDIAWVHADPDAVYEQVLEYDVSQLTQQLSCPQGVDNVHPIDEALGTPLDEVYIGSCTNGNLEDLEIAASILKGRTAREGLRFVVVPATNDVYKSAMRLGYIRTFVEAGAVICHPCCGLCAGMPYGLLAKGENLLITANRNFIGRMGSKESFIYLSSPAVAAASAIAGEIAKP